jgi:hypothetical protein
MTLNSSIYKHLFKFYSGLVTGIGLGYGALPASAIALNGVSGSWSNLMGGFPETLEFFNVGDESQVRWGTPPDLEGYKSGLGFIGTGATEIAVGESFLVGQLRHFNNIVFTNTAATAVDLDLTLEFGNPVVSSAFNFTLEIDETLNIEPCTYLGTTICPDKISFPSTQTSKSITIENENYTLELLGFSPTPNGTPVNEMISEELGESNTFFYIFGRLISDKSSSQTIPDPETILGLSFLTIYLLKTQNSRKN